MVDVSTDGEHWWGTLPRPLAAALGAWWAGYAVAVAVAVGLTVAGPFRVTPLSLVLPVVVVPLLALVLALRPVAADDPDVLGRRLGFARVPDSVRRAVRPGLAGAAVLLGVGLVVVLAAVALSWDQVSTISTAVAAGGLGAVVLALAQVVALPNLALWAVSFMAGPGFRVVEGGSVSWSGSRGGLLPMVPVLAALPQPGPFPWFARALGARRGRGGGVRRPPGAHLGRAAVAAAHQARRGAVGLTSPPSPSPCSTSWPAGRPGSSGWLPSARRPAGSFLALLLGCALGALRSCCATPGSCAGDRVVGTPLGLVVLVSGSGSNLQALIDASAHDAAPFRVLAVGADRDGTGGAERAERAGIPTFVARVPDYVTRADWDLDLQRLVAEHDPDLVVSAGFMKVLGPAVLAAHRVVNTHPALLPSFPGRTGCATRWPTASRSPGARATGSTPASTPARSSTSAPCGRARRHRRVAARADQGARARHARRGRARPRHRPLLAVAAGLSRARAGGPRSPPAARR